MPRTTGVLETSNRFGDGPFEDRFVRVVLPQGIEIEGVYNAARGVQPERYWLDIFVLRNGECAWTIGQRWAPTEKGARALLASVARSVHAWRRSIVRHNTRDGGKQSSASSNA